MRMRTLGHLWPVSALTLGNPPATEVPARLERSLDASLERMHLSFVDLFVLHGYMVNTDDDAADDRFSTELDLQTRVMAAGLHRQHPGDDARGDRVPSGWGRLGRVGHLVELSELSLWSAEAATT
jgi:hypothetical protein